MWTNERCRAWAKAKRPNTFMNRESDVTIETMVLAGQGFDFGMGKRFFFDLQIFKNSFGAQSASYSIGTGFFPECKATGA